MSENTCFKSKCLSCTDVDGCGWCNGPNAVAVGDCMPETDAAQHCSAALVIESDQCPSVGADVIIKNISGMVGAMLAVAILLNVCNRLSNRRKSRKLQKSIFTLPVYVYSASTRERAKAARAARAPSQGGADALEDIERAGADPLSSTSSSASSSAMAAAEGTTSPGSCPAEEDVDSAAVVTCTICLAPYEEEEVIKVLPCGHDFHSGCLDSWLELKAICPLCKEPAFTKSRDRSWTPQGAAQTPEPGLSTAASPPLLRSTSNSPSHLRGSSLSRGVGSGGLVSDGLLLATQASPPPPTRPPSRAAITGVCISTRADDTRESGTGAGRTRLLVEGVEDMAVQTVADDASSQAEAETAHNAATPAERGTVGDGAPVAPVLVDTARDVGATSGGLGGTIQGRNFVTSTSPSPCHGGASPKGLAYPRETSGDIYRETSLDQLETGRAGPPEAGAAAFVGPATDDVGKVDSSTLFAGERPGASASVRTAADTSADGLAIQDRGANLPIEGAAFAKDPLDNVSPGAE